MTRRDQPADPAPPPKPNPMLWHAISAEEALAALGSRPGGLTAAEAEERRRRYGPNEIKAAEGISPWRLLLQQFANVLVLILLAGAVASAFLGEEIEALAIAIIVLFAVVLGFIQEYRAERAIAALKRMAAPTATVLRGGEPQQIPARDLVPGDVILLSPGDRCPADGRLLEAVNLRTEEAALTGESMPIEKTAALLTTPAPQGEEDRPLGDRLNVVYAGTAVTYGRGRALVTATGMDTEFGKIAGMLEEVEPGKTSLEKALHRVGSTLARAAFVIVAVIALAGWLRGQSLPEMFLFAIALAVAVVPEALPAVVTISLALGVQRMVKRHALVRRLPAVETLGSVSVICSDKTGTLTRDEMTVRALWAAGERIRISGAGYEAAGELALADGGDRAVPRRAIEDLLSAAVLANDARLVADGDGFRAQGDSTEVALLVAARKAGLEKAELDARFPRTGEIPFTSETRRMITVHADGEGGFACAKGAPEALLPLCSAFRAAAGDLPLTGADRARILEEAHALAAEALRVLAVAGKRAAALGDAATEMTFLGLVGMIDPPRPEAAAAIRTCERAGITVVMITGDHPETAAAVARELGLLTGDPAVQVITGAELEELPDEELARRIEDLRVYARVNPAHKLRVVTAWQEKGRFVAMTGDGVNDAPALKKADIGIAMGLTGTEVTREAAAMTLTDDNFASIVAAVEEGRGIFGNIKKYLMYLLSSNVGELGLMTLATVTGMPLPLSAVQILYVNLATDGLPALALAVDPPAPDLMRRPPRDPSAAIFTRPVVGLMLVGGGWLMLVCAGLFLWAQSTGRSIEEARTMVFAGMVFIEFFKAYCFRSDRISVFHRPFANRWLNLAILWELALLFLVIYLPPLEKLFGTVSLPAGDLALVALAAATVVPVLEAGKAMVRRGWLAKKA